MTGAGDGMTVFDPPRAHPVSPPITAQKNAPRGGGSRIAARSSEHGEIVRNWGELSKARASLTITYETET